MRGVITTRLQRAAWRLPAQMSGVTEIKAARAAWIVNIYINKYIYNLPL
jgi:hypothetical protein